MKHNVLLVDDDANLLESYRRKMRSYRNFETAKGALEGLKLVENNGPYAVIITDYRMPGMDGIQFLYRVQEIAPDSVRIMLTGYADLNVAINAVNEGNIFRFLTKPCDSHLFINALFDGIKQYRLVMAEKELLEETLNGSIKALTEVLSFSAPEALAHASRVVRHAVRIGQKIDYPKMWELETAARLSLIGAIILPDDILDKISHRLPLLPNENVIFNKHPEFAANLIGNIPRMDRIADIIRYQEKRFDGSGVPEDSVQGKDIPLGARILKIVLDYVLDEGDGKRHSEALHRLKSREGRYDPDIIEAFETVITSEVSVNTKIIKASEFMEGMILDEDVYTTNGKLALFKGQEITQAMSLFMKKFAQTRGVIEPIRVVLPAHLEV